MADAIALIDDLFFLAKVHETAKQTGVTLETAATGEQLLKAAAASPAALILVDLNAKQGALEAVERLCAANGPGNPRRVIAFLSHVQTDLAERARSAGCQDVMPRSKFTQNLAEILRGAKS
jgi:CheY-like chemotaxis protein